MKKLLALLIVAAMFTVSVSAASYNLLENKSKWEATDGDVVVTWNADGSVTFDGNPKEAKSPTERFPWAISYDQKFPGDRWIELVVNQEFIGDPGPNNEVPLYFFAHQEKGHHKNGGDCGLFWLLIPASYMFMDGGTYLNAYSPEDRSTLSFWSYRDPVFIYKETPGHKLSGVDVNYKVCFQTVNGESRVLVYVNNELFFDEPDPNDGTMTNNYITFGDWTANKMTIKKLVVTEGAMPASALVEEVIEIIEEEGGAETQAVVTLPAVISPQTNDGIYIFALMFILAGAVTVLKSKKVK